MFHWTMITIKSCLIRKFQSFLKVVWFEFNHFFWKPQKNVNIWIFWRHLRSEKFIETLENVLGEQNTKTKMANDLRFWQLWLGNYSNQFIQYASIRMVRLFNGYSVFTLLLYAVIYHLFLHWQRTSSRLFEKFLHFRCNIRSEFVLPFREFISKFKMLFSILKGFLVYITALSKTRFTWKRLLNVSGKHLYRDDSSDSRYNRVCSEFLDESIKSYIKKFLTANNIIVNCNGCASVWRSSWWKGDIIQREIADYQSKSGIGIRGECMLGNDHWHTWFDCIL